MSPTQSGAERLDPNRLPRHLAIIMDGNGRWAKERGLSRVKGHFEGSESVREVVRACRKLGLEVLTLFAFSTENWGRPKTEVRALMELLKRFLRKERQEMIDQSIRLKSIGQIERLPGDVRRLLEQTVAATAKGDKMVLNLALSYGSRAEIASACQRLAQRCLTGRLRPEEIDENRLAVELMDADLPEVDLLIRTSGEHRLSNFLLWQAAYAELLLTPILWPDFREAELIEALVEYQARERRFGLTSEQIQSGDPSGEEA